MLRGVSTKGFCPMILQFGCPLPQYFSYETPAPGGLRRIRQPSFSNYLDHAVRLPHSAPSYCRPVRIVNEQKIKFFFKSK